MPECKHFGLYYYQRQRASGKMEMAHCRDCGQTWGAWSWVELQAQLPPRWWRCWDPTTGKTTYVRDIQECWQAATDRAAREWAADPTNWVDRY